MKISRKVKQLISDSKSVLILVSRPIDLDCLGSGIGLASYLRRGGKKVDLYSAFDIPSPVDELPLFETVTKDKVTDLDFGGYDLVIAIDGGNPRQFAQVASDEEFNFAGVRNLLNIDHHEGNLHFSKFEIWDPQASSTSEVILGSIVETESLDKNEATLFYAGLVGDTGNFKYNFTSHTLDLASRLLNKGADQEFIIDKYFYHNKKSDFRVFSEAIRKTEFNEDLGYSMLVIDEKEWKKHLKVRHSDIESGIYLYKNLFMRAIQGIKMGFLLVKTGKGYFVQYRGNAYRNSFSIFDIAEEMDSTGQGHANAGGFLIKGDDLEAITKKLERAIAKLSDEK
jgi:phosphoesterase RecJ-like protein